MNSSSKQQLKRDALQQGFVDGSRNAAHDQSQFLRGLGERFRNQYAAIARVDLESLPRDVDGAFGVASRAIEALKRQQERLCLTCGESIAPRFWRRCGTWVLLLALLGFDGLMLDSVLSQQFKQGSKEEIFEAHFCSYGISVVLLGTLLHMLGHQIRLFTIASHQGPRFCLILLLAALPLGILSTTWALRCGYGWPKPAEAQEDILRLDVAPEDVRPKVEVRPLEGAMKPLFGLCMFSSLVVGVLLGYEAPINGVVRLRRPPISPNSSKELDGQEKQGTATSLVVDLGERRRLYREASQWLRTLELLQRFYCEVVADYQRGAVLASRVDSSEPPLTTESEVAKLVGKVLASLSGSNVRPVPVAEWQEPAFRPIPIMNGNPA